MDAHEFRLLFEQSKDGIFRYIRARTRNRDDALDVLQDTYVDLWKALSAGKFVYRRDNAFIAYLCTIARRRAGKLYRFSKATVSIDDIEDISIADKSAASAEDVLSLLQEVEKLSAEDKEVIRLRYFSGLSFKQIAGLLDGTEDAMKMRHHRAIKKLKEMLNYDPFDKTQDHGE